MTTYEYKFDNDWKNLKPGPGWKSFSVINIMLEVGPTWGKLPGYYAVDLAIFGFHFWCQWVKK
jgi:hypothetical protein